MNLGGAIHVNKPGLCLICGTILILFIYLFTGTSPASEGTINLKHLLKVAIKAAENGGFEVVSTKDNLNIKSKGLTKEGLQDSVTTADYLSHCSMIGTLKRVYPALNVISEEAKTICEKNQQIDHSKSPDIDLEQLDDVFENLKDVTVWIDPLDATKEYTEKLYEYVTTMVCVAVKGRPVIGVIHKPFLNSKSKTSWAWVNKSKSSNLDSVTNTEHHKLKIIISRSHSGKIRDILGEMAAYNLTVAAGAGYKALEVATGKSDAYIHITAIKKWDICAGNAIINALGGHMTTKLNETIDYTDLTNVVDEKGLVATLKNHDLFLKLLT